MAILGDLRVARKRSNFGLYGWGNGIMQKAQRIRNQSGESVGKQ
jgi:hypothetical protein